MPIDFPSGPTTGQVYTYQGKSWIYNGISWDAPKGLSEIGSVQAFANAAARTAAIPTPTEGIVTYLNDVDRLDVHNGGGFVPAAGLNFIKQETGSAVNEIIINNCFSNLYKNYQIICNVLLTGGLVNFRLRSGTTNESNSVYRVARLDVEGSSVVGLRELNTAQWGGLITPGSLSENIMSLSNPFQTGVTSGAFERIEEPAGNINLRKLMLGINSTASYHGISLIMPTGTMTGTVTVYGYNLG